MKEDRLLPMVTLVIYFDSKEWDGPLSIHEMFTKQNPRVLARIPNYEVNLLAPAGIEDCDFGKFQSSLKEVLSFIKYARDKDELKKVLDEDAAFRNLGRNEVDVLNACVGAKITVDEGEEAIDVCLAIQQMNEEAAQKERIATLLSNIKNLMEKMGWSAEQSMEVLGVSENDKRALLQQLRCNMSRTVSNGYGSAFPWRELRNCRTADPSGQYAEQLKNAKQESTGLGPRYW